MSETTAPAPQPVTIQGIPAGADDLGQESFDFLAGASCNPNAPEDCEACQ